MTDRYKVPGISLPSVPVADDLDGEELVLVLENGELKLKAARTVAQSLLQTVNGATVLVGADGVALLNNGSAVAAPYILASWGDSRANVTAITAPTFDVSASAKTLYRSASWVEALMGDADLQYNFGYSGGTAANWDILTASDRATHGKTIKALEAIYTDVVVMQLGVNDAIAGTAAATIVGYLKENIVEILKQGKRLLFEAIYPVNTPGTNYEAAQVIVDAVNASMAAWVPTLPASSIKYVDVATPLKDANGYLSTAYSDATGIHPNAAAAKLIAALDVAAIREWLPKRVAQFYSPEPKAPNMLNLFNPTTPQNQVFLTAVGGSTWAAISPTVGEDSYGSYIDIDLQPTALASGVATARIDFSANFNTSVSPYYALLGNEKIQGGVKCIIDDGNGGASSVIGFGFRQRNYTAAAYNDWGISAAVASTEPAIGYVDAQVNTPKLLNLTASASAVPSAGSGYQLQFFICVNTLDALRVRVYNPRLGAVGFVNSVLTAASFDIPASTVAYTNASTGKQQITVGGGTVSEIALNGVATGLTAGVFILNPGDTMTPTYSAAPTWTINHIQ